MKNICVICDIQDGVADIPLMEKNPAPGEVGSLFHYETHGFLYSWPRPTTGSFSLVEIPLVELLGPTVVFFSPRGMSRLEVFHSCLA